MTPALTSAQLVTLGTHIKANTIQIAIPQGNTAIKDVTNPDNFQDVANWYNQLGISASPGGTPGTAHWVFKSALGQHEFTEQTGLADSDGVTTTTFNYSQQGGYIARSPGEQDAFRLLFNTALNCKPSLPNVRTAFDDIFSGSGAGAIACRNHFRAMARRLARIVEHLFVTDVTAGYTNPVASGVAGARTRPGTLPVEGELTAAEVASARAAAP